eukprot:6191180-Pleurochrysis_carterae.AAC.2
MTEYGCNLHSCAIQQNLQIPPFFSVMKIASVATWNEAYNAPASDSTFVAHLCFFASQHTSALSGDGFDANLDLKARKPPAGGWK